MTEYSLNCRIFLNVRSTYFVLQVHQCLLKVTSAYFEGLFNSETTEKVTGRLIMRETTEEAVEGLVDFIYLGNVPQSCLKTPEVVDLFVLAHR